MNCAEFENVVVAIARDELIEAEANLDALAHADECPRCARRLAGERMLSDTAAAVIAQDSTRRAPARVDKMVIESFRERQEAGGRRRVWIRWVATGAIAAVLLIGSAIMLRRTVRTPAANGTVTLEDNAEAGDEVTTDFMPLSYDPAPAGATSVVRVELPRSALIAFGLPVNEDRTEEVVQADLLLDEDGLTRAVRFVE